MFLFEKKPKILHVDDDRDFIDIFSIIFRDYYDFEFAPDATAAFEMFNREYYDAVITDYDLPEINGLEFLKMIREKDENIPVIFYTGQGNEEVAREAFFLGATDYVTKEYHGTVNKEKLVHSINQSIEKKNIIEDFNKNKKLLEEQILFSNSRNQLVEIILSNNNVRIVMDNMTKIIGKALKLDKIHLTYTDFIKNRIKFRSNWTNHDIP